MGEATPRFRQDLVAVTADAEGVACVDVQDPRTGTSFRFYDFEYALALQLNGQPTEDVVSWASVTYGIDLTPEGIAEFSGQLAGLGFLERATPARPAAVVEEDHAPLSQMVSQAVTTVPAAPDHAAAAGAYGDFTFGQNTEPDSGEVAEAEWSGLEGARTVTSAPDTKVEERAAFPVPNTDRDMKVPAAIDDDATSHWARGTGAAGEPTPEKKAGWAWDLNSTLKSGPHKASSTDVATTLQGVPPPADPELTMLADEPTSDLEATPAPTLAPPQPTVPARSPTPTLAVPAADAADWWRVSPATAEAPQAPPKVDLPAPEFVAPKGNDRGPDKSKDRRLPPAPEAVVMSAFQNAGEITAPQKLFRTQEVDIPPKRGRGAVVAIVVFLALTVGIALYLWRQQVDRAQIKQVRVVAPKPTAVYRWFEGTGAVVGGTARVMAFEVGGRVAEILPAATSFSAGEIIAKLYGADVFELEVDRHRSRVAYYEQMRDSTRAAGNQPEMRQAEIKIGIKQMLLVEAEKNLLDLVVRPAESGEIAEVFVKAGQQVAPHASVLRIKGGRLRGEFAFEDKDWEAATRLGFCRVEVVGLAPRASNGSGRHRGGATSAADSGPSDAEGSPKFIDCKLNAVPASAVAAAGDVRPRTMVVELPAGAAVKVGQPLRLARARYDAVFPIPREAIVRFGDTDRVYVVSRSGIAEPRAVTVADTDGEEALVNQGLDIGDAVIVEAPPGLRDGSRLRIER